MTEELVKFIAVATNPCEPHSVASLERVSLQRRDSQCCAMRRSVAVPLVIVAGVVVAAPRLFKRAWRDHLSVTLIDRLQTLGSLRSRSG